MKKLITIAVASAVLLASAAGFAASRFSDVPTDHPQREDIDYAVAQQWFYGYEDGTFQPDSVITQKQIITVINRAFPEGATRADLATFMRAGHQALNEAERRTLTSFVSGASIEEICAAMQTGYEADKAQGRIGYAGTFQPYGGRYVENSCQRTRYIGDHGIDAQRFIREGACANESGGVNTYEQEFTVFEIRGSSYYSYSYKQAFATIGGTKQAMRIMPHTGRSVEIGNDFWEHCARNRCLSATSSYHYDLKAGEYNSCINERINFEASTYGTVTVTGEGVGTRQGYIHPTLFRLEIIGPTPGADLPETIHITFRPDDGSQDILATLIFHSKMPVP